MKLGIIGNCELTRDQLSTLVSADVCEITVDPESAKNYEIKEFCEQKGIKYSSPYTNDGERDMLMGIFSSVMLTDAYLSFYGHGNDGEKILKYTSTDGCEYIIFTDDGCKRICCTD